VNWSDFTPFYTTSSDIDAGPNFSVWFDGTYVHYAFVDPTAMENLYYRRGKPNPDGSITWSAGEQIAFSNPYGVDIPMVAVDSGGYPVIGFLSHDLPWVTKSARNDGVWETAGGFPYQLSTSASVRVAIAPLSNGKFYALYVRSGIPQILGRLWDGGFGSEELCTPYEVSVRISATSDGDDVYLAFIVPNARSRVLLAKRTYGIGWESEDFDPMIELSPYVEITAIEGVGIVYFWAYPTAEGKQYIYYKKRVGGTWDATPTLWSDETGKLDMVTYGLSLSSNYKKDAFVSVLWHRKLTNEVMYGFDPMVPEVPAAGRVVGDGITWTA
jgi:hypothetical protein